MDDQDRRLRASLYRIAISCAFGGGFLAGILFGSLRAPSSLIPLIFVPLLVWADLPHRR